MKKNLFIFLFVICVSAIIVYGQKKLPMKDNANAPSTKDTTFSKQYVFRYTIPAESLMPTLDTIQGVLNLLGKSLTVDQAAQYSEMASRSIRRLIGNAQLDSIVIRK
jgi:hypothetical protein